VLALLIPALLLAVASVVLGIVSAAQGPRRR